jgi:hypothetical protein
MKQVVSRVCLIVSCLLALSPSAGAQEKLEIFGYYEPQYLGTYVNRDTYQLFTNKLRVDLRYALSGHITFAANFDFITYHGKTRWSVLEFLSSDIADQVPEAARPLYTIPFENEIFLDNAFLKLSFPALDLTAGKQQISLGTGYVWNPVDVFNTKDVLDPTYEQPGHNAVRLDVPAGGRSTVTALYSPEASWSESGKLLEIKAGAGRFDLSLDLIETFWVFHDYTRFDPEAQDFTALPGKRRLLGGSAVGELLGLGVWAEFAYNWMERTDDYYELVLGGDYTFDSQTYVMTEYYRNTLGKSDFRDYSLNDWMRFFTAEQKAVSRDQLYVFLQHPVTDLLNLGVQDVLSLSDGSMALAPTAFYSLSDSVELFAYLSFSIGSEGKAYGANNGHGGLLRLRVYF